MSLVNPISNFGSNFLVKKATETLENVSEGNGIFEDLGEKVQNVDPSQLAVEFLDALPDTSDLGIDKSSIKLIFDAFKEFFNGKDDFHTESVNGVGGGIRMEDPPEALSDFTFKGFFEGLKNVDPKSLYF